MSGAEKPPDLPIPNDSILHYEGFLDVKAPKDKEYSRQWVMLIDNKMVTYVQKVTLREQETSPPVDTLYIDRHCTVTPDSKERTKLSMKTKAGTYKFKMNSIEDRDNWWIRFHAMCKLDLPQIHLLPGQTIALQEIIERMKQITPHRDLPSKSPTTKSPTVKSPLRKTFVKASSLDKKESQDDMNRRFGFYPEDLVKGFRDDFPIPPTWYFEVPRNEAQELLLNNPDHGSIIIRKSESQAGFALSMRQDPPARNPHAMPTIKHYKFAWSDKEKSFKMNIEEEQPQLKTMYDLLAFFIEKHGGNIRPMMTRDLRTPQHPYELELRNEKDPENGEASKQAQDPYLVPNRGAPGPPSKPRPDRQSLPASFNMTLPEISQGANASAVGPNNRLSLATSETARSSNPSQYVVPNHNRPMYINVGRDKLPTVREDADQTLRRRHERFSTSVVPDRNPSDIKPPNLPPPRQRCVSTSDATDSHQLSLPNNGNLTDVYNTPTGHAFVLPRQQTSPLLPVTTAEAKRERETRLRSKTSPATMDDIDYLTPIKPKLPPKPESGNKPLPLATNMDDIDSYLTPIKSELPPKPELGNQPLPLATKPSSQQTVANEPVIYKPPITIQSGCHMTPPTSYLHPGVRARGNSVSTLPEGKNTVNVELNEVFKKFGIDKSK